MVYYLILGRNLNTSLHYSDLYLSKDYALEELKSLQRSYPSWILELYIIDEELLIRYGREYPMVNIISHIPGPNLIYFLPESQ